jgi:hypothetical protein
VRKSLVLFGAALALSVGAAAPMDIDKLEYDESVLAADGGELAGGKVETARTYPPCRRGRADDNCIQLYERAVRQARLRVDLPAMGGPYERSAPYPDCSRIITDECVQRFDGASRRRARTQRPAPSAEPETPGI